MKIGILTNGYISDYKFYKSIIKDYNIIVCADGGLKHAFNMGIMPHVALGDFDSTPPEILHYFKQKKCKFIKHPGVKDETDTELALDYAAKQNPDEIDILAGLGTRFDHSLANVHLLKKMLEKNIKTKILTEHNEIILVDTNTIIKGQIGEGISLLPLTPSVTNIYTSGLGYPIKNGKLEVGKPYGVSNYMTSQEAHIKFTNGLLLVMKYKD